MAFTFQINNDLEFIHDEYLLSKAEANNPTIYKTEVSAYKVVDLIEDSSKQNGIWIQESTKELNTPMAKGDSVILDFMDHRVGRFSIDIDSVGSPMDAPLYIRVKFAEIPAEFNADSADYNGWLSRSWIQEEYIHLDTLPARLELPRRYSFRYVEIKVIDTSFKWKAVFSNPLVVCESSVKHRDLKELSVEDPLLKKICDVSVKTLEDCMQNVFEDGPKRDRRLWLGDLRLQALANYATFDNVSLVKKCLYLFAGMTTKEGKISANVFVLPKNVPDDTFLYEYSLFFISTLYDLHQAHPDLELVKELYPTCKKQMDITLSMFDEKGKLIVDENYPIFVDWSNAFNKDTAGQAETIYVLKQFISLAELANEKNLDFYKEKLALLTEYAKSLYNPEKKLFVTTNDEYNIASQVWMVLAHVMDENTNHEIMKESLRTFFPVKGIATPYMYHHICQALFEGNCKEEAIQLIKEYWGKMIDLGADTFWEAFDPDQPEFSPYGSPIVNSYCHAWSCTPVYLIQKYCI